MTSMATTLKTMKKTTKSVAKRNSSVAATLQASKAEARRKLVRQAFKLAITLHRDALKELERY